MKKHSIRLTILLCAFLMLFCLGASPTSVNRESGKLTSTAAMENWTLQKTAQAVQTSSAPTSVPTRTPHPVHEYPSMLFGKFEQDGQIDNGEEPIEWLIVEEDEKTLTLISEYILKSSQMYDKYFPITWEDCIPRRWLNDEFYESAFSDEEKAAILLSLVHTENNPEYDTDGGNDTYDHVFLPSIEEASRWFTDEIELQASATDFAQSDGVYQDPDYQTACWWLRSPGGDPRWIAFVDFYSGIAKFGRDDYFWYNGLRPVIILDKSLLK